MADKVKSTVFVVTGNRLHDGRVVYLRADRTWGPDLDAALEIAEPTRRDELVAWGQREERLTVTGIYALEIGITESGARVLSARERLRAAGETQVRKRLGIE